MPRPMKPLATVICPHCITLPAADLICCVCNSTRRLDARVIANVMRNVWAREGCSCTGCTAHHTTERHIIRRLVIEARSAA